MTHNQLTLQANRINEFNAYETQRHNVATETETNRHQLKMEELEDFKNGVLNYQAIEQQRHNMRLEDIQNRNVNVEYYKAQENARHNRESERINAWLASSDEFMKHESARHNKAMEVIDTRKTVADSIYKSAAGANQMAQASKYRAEADYLNRTMKSRVSQQGAETIITYENVVLNPFRAGADAINGMMRGVGGILKYAK